MRHYLRWGEWQYRANTERCKYDLSCPRWKVKFDSPRISNLQPSITTRYIVNFVWKDTRCAEFGDHWHGEARSTGGWNVLASLFCFLSCFGSHLCDPCKWLLRFLHLNTTYGASLTNRHRRRRHPVTAASHIWSSQSQSLSKSASPVT
jgi:hypothetical protein